MGALNVGQLASQIITITLLLIFVLISVYTNRKRENIFEEEGLEDISDFHLEATKKIRRTFTLKTSKNIEIKFVDGLIQPSVMFALMGNVYINTNKKYNYKIINDVHFEGVLSHELGHAMHMPDIYFIANLRPTAILGNLLFVIIFNFSRILNRKKNKILNYFVFSLFYVFYVLFNTINLFILYPFKRYEEFEADKASLNFANGYSLRGYYYKLYNQHNSKLDSFRFKFIDFNHPTPIKHYYRLNKEIESTNDNCEFTSNNRIEVKKFTDETDRLNQIVRFYEAHGDSSIISMYMFIGKKYEELENYVNAKEYYLLAGKNDIFSGYRRLIKLLKAEGDVDNVLEYYKILSKNGDKEANIYIAYYEKEFLLYKVTIDGEESDLEEKVTIAIMLNDTFIKNINGIEETGKITRKRTILKMISDNGVSREYYLNEGEITSKQYSIYDSDTDSIMQVKEYYSCK
jgi:hypothetical protein